MPVKFKISVVLVGKSLKVTIPKELAEHLTLKKGDTVVMFTDGVTESINAKEELFGEKRLIEIIKKNAHLSAQMVLEQVLSGVRAFAGDVPQFDDITLLIIKGK